MTRSKGRNMVEERRGSSGLPIGGLILEAGNTRDYRTGGWRTFRPILDRDKCNDCLLCFWYCPDSSVLVSDGKVLGFDLDHCKGCGICAEVCPPKIKAITMVEEVRVQTPPAEGGGAMKVTDRLRQEHRTILEQLEALEQAILHAQEEASPEGVQGLVDALEEFLEGHMRKEEEVLFPYLEGFLGRVGGPVGAGWEHEGIYRDLLFFARELARPGGLTEEANRQAWRARGETLIQGLRKHIRKEEEVLFPIAERLISPDLLEEIAAELEA